MDFEAVVMHYLAAEGLFLSPQFSVRDDSGGEWSCPDLVALDFSKHQVQVVEMTTASNVSALVEKIRQRENQWFRHLRQQLVTRRAIDGSWSIVVRAFVREENVENVRRVFNGAKDVIVEPIESVTFSWKWPWDRFPKA